MVKLQLQLTDSFRREFNRNYCLDIDGKLFGLGKLVELGIFPLFLHKFSKQVVNEKIYSRVRMLNHVRMRVSGHTVKCYFK